MNKSLYYGEISAKIAAHLFKNPEHIKMLESKIEDQYEEGITIWTVCADAGRVFDTLEDLSGEHFINWQKALTHYAETLLENILNRQKIYMVDMIAIAADSIKNARA